VFTSHHDQDVLDSAVEHLTDDEPDEWFAAERQQQFRLTHAARGTGGKNDGTDHGNIVRSVERW
jgi:hypothetical protein